MKTAKLFWGLGFLFAAALIILDVVGVIPTLLSAVGEVSIFSLILGFFLLSYALRRLFRGRISAIFRTSVRCLRSARWIFRVPRGFRLPTAVLRWYLIFARFPRLSMFRSSARFLP